MTAQSAIPLKWYVPFAQGDSSRVEIPVTTPDPTRASQTLGFPPLTMQPPESGGVPPQGEDFNGGMNQVARICWWILNGGGWPYDSTFATNSNINGYPNGAKLQTADFLGSWISVADNNQANPDTNGGNWVPGYVYGEYALTGQAGGTTTLGPNIAKFRRITVSGTLTSALTIIVPAWSYDWTVVNNTTGAFVVVVKTASGSGVTIPQTSQPTRVHGDGTNVVQAPENVATATQSTKPVQLGQANAAYSPIANFSHGQCRFLYGSATSCTLVPFGGDCINLNGITYNLPSAGVTLSNSGLSASTGYYVYAYWTGSAIALEAVVTAPATAANGVRVKTGDATRSLVGQVYTNSSSQFQQTNSFNGVLTYFNKKSLGLQPGTATGTFTATSPTEINSALRVSTITWGDEALDATLDGFASGAVSQAAVVTGMGIDSNSVISGQLNQFNAAFAGAAGDFSSRNTPTLAELTLHTFYALGYTSTGSGSWNASMKVIVRG